MNKRINKKLSKRLSEILPNEYKDAWKMSRSDDDGYILKGTLCLGGGVDYWGEGQDHETIFECYSQQFGWSGIFGFHPEGHPLSGYPLLDKKRFTGKRAIEIAKIESKQSLRRCYPLINGITLERNANQEEFKLDIDIFSKQPSSDELQAFVDTLNHIANKSP